MSKKINSINLLKKNTLKNISLKTFKLAEGPIWDWRSNILYFVDIKSKNLFSFSKNILKKYSFHQNVTSVLLSNLKNKIFIILKNQILLYDIRKRKIEKIKKYKLSKNERFNDSFVSNHNEVLISSMDNLESKKIGKLYLFNNLNNFKTIMNNFVIGNGIDYCKKTDNFFFSISDKRQILKFKIKNKNIFKKKIFYKMSKKYGFPDGITLDKKGFLWIACWGSNHIIQLKKNAKIKNLIFTPEKYVTSLTFGGKKLNKIFFTSAKNNKVKKSGKVYELNLNEVGVKTNYVNLQKFL